MDTSAYQGAVWLDHLHHWVPSMTEALAHYRELGFFTLDLGPQSSGYHWAGCFLGLTCVELFEIQDWEKVRSFSPPLARRVERLLEEGGGITKLFLGVPDMVAILARLEA